MSLGWKDGESLLPSRALGLFDHPRNGTGWLSNQISSDGGSCVWHRARRSWRQAGEVRKPQVASHPAQGSSSSRAVQEQHRGLVRSHGFSYISALTTLVSHLHLHLTVSREPESVSPTASSLPSQTAMLAPAQAPSAYWETPDCVVTLSSEYPSLSLLLPSDLSSPTLSHLPLGLVLPCPHLPTCFLYHHRTAIKIEP